MTRSWWVPVTAVAALALGAVAWLVLIHIPADLPALGRQMVAVIVIALSLAPVLLIKPSEESRP